MSSAQVDSESLIGRDHLPVKQLRSLVHDLQEPSRWIFWTDLICCLLAIQGGLFVYSEGLLNGRALVSLPGFVIAVLAVYRASYFNHEVAHHARRLPGFETAWNLSVGIPLLIPSFLYSDHRNHHSDNAFATKDDVEYLPERLRNVKGAAALLTLAFLLPILYVLRFAVLAPAAWFSPSVRRWVDTRASGIGLLGLTCRSAPTDVERRSWRWHETACFFYLLAVGVLLTVGILSIIFVLQFYSVMIGMLMLHGLRVMVGHRYEASDSGCHDRIAQVGDSFNFTHNRFLMSVLLPLGFDMHALHHLFPNIPYHNLTEAHRRVTAFLPDTSVYHSVESKSYFREIMRFIFRKATVVPPALETSRN